MHAGEHRDIAVFVHSGVRCSQWADARANARPDAKPDARAVVKPDACSADTRGAGALAGGRRWH